MTHQKAKPQPVVESPVKRRKRELELDLELEGTFPASDPPSSTQPVHPSSEERRRDKDCRQGRPSRS
jgi:hypothetical protein